MKITSQTVKAFTCTLLALFAVACVVRGPADVRQHRWWSGLGPVLPHDTFPADCSLCHTGEGWHELREDFEFDHEQQTGVALLGAHSSATGERQHARGVRMGAGSTSELERAR